MKSAHGRKKNSSKIYISVCSVSIAMGIDPVILMTISRVKKSIS